jgi:hypothetical protein
MSGLSVLRLLVVLRDGRRVCWDSVIDAWGLWCAIVTEGFGLWCCGCRDGTGGDVDIAAGIFGGVFFPSKVILVGVNAVETSDTESFRIINWAGDAGGEADFSEVGFASNVAAIFESKDVVDGGIGKSGIEDFKGVDDETASSVVREFFRFGISSNFHSWDPVILRDLLFLRRDRSDIFRPRASVASFAFAVIEFFRSWDVGGVVSCRGGVWIGGVLIGSLAMSFCIWGFASAGDWAWNPKTGLSMIELKWDGSGLFGIEDLSRTRGIKSPSPSSSGVCGAESSFVDFLLGISRSEDSSGVLTVERGDTSPLSFNSVSIIADIFLENRFELNNSSSAAPLTLPPNNTLWNAASDRGIYNQSSIEDKYRR